MWNRAVVLNDPNLNPNRNPATPEKVTAGCDIEKEIREQTQSPNIKAKDLQEFAKRRGGRTNESDAGFVRFSLAELNVVVSLSPASPLLTCVLQLLSGNLNQSPPTMRPGDGGCNELVQAGLFSMPPSPKRGCAQVGVAKDANLNGATRDSRGLQATVGLLCALPGYPSLPQENVAI
jgi:hypothetical protein